EGFPMLWLRRWFARTVSPSRIRPGRQGLRPELETLEDRRLPSINTALAVPTPLGPSGTAPALPTFSWSAVAGAARYHFSLTDATTQQAVADVATAGTSLAPSSPLTGGDTYDWAVQAVDSNGNTSPWSATVQFTDSGLAPPILIGPSNATTPLPTFSWNAVTSAASYTLTLTDQTTQHVEQFTGLTATSWTPSSPLTSDNTYQWSVQAVDSAGFAGASSSALTIGVSNMTAPILVAPTGAAAPLPTFSWNAVAGADHY